MSTQAGPGDRQLRCADCGGNFSWSVEEQAFFKEKGYEQPKRCKPCRQAKKAQRGEGGQQRENRR
jgi:Probable zinc-ribbon domain